MIAAVGVDLDVLVRRIGTGIARRILQLVRAADRADALDGRSGAMASEELADAASRAAVSREMVARALRLAADARSTGLLKRAAGGDGLPVAALAADAGLPRLAAGRIVDDLVDGGLAERDLATDAVRATDLGSAVLLLLDELEREAAAEVARGLGTGT